MDKKNIANLSQNAQVKETATISIAGMTCDNCARRVDRALRSLKGIEKVSIDRPRGIASVVYDSSVVDLPAMHGAVLKSGYKPVSVSQPG